MPLSRAPSARRRPQLGSPKVSINPTPAYLRHRVAADRAQRARRRSVWFCRIGIAAAACLLYVAIGRDLVALVGAKSRAVGMEVARETQRVEHDIEQISEIAARTSAHDLTSPVQFTSAAGLAAEQEAEVDAWLSGQPVEPTSRLR